MASSTAPDALAAGRLPAVNGHTPNTTPKDGKLERIQIIYDEKKFTYVVHYLS